MIIITDEHRKAARVCISNLVLMGGMGIAAERIADCEEIIAHSLATREEMERWRAVKLCNDKLVQLIEIRNNTENPRTEMQVGCAIGNLVDVAKAIQAGE